MRLRDASELALGRYRFHPSRSLATAQTSVTAFDVITTAGKSDIYWATRENLGAVRKLTVGNEAAAAGNPTQLAQGPNIAALAAGYPLYWSTMSGISKLDATGVVRNIHSDAAVRYLDKQTRNDVIRVIWVSSNRKAFMYLNDKLVGNASAPTTVLTASSITAVAVTGETYFVATSDGIKRIVMGTTPTVSDFAPAVKNATSLAADGAFVYWITSDGAISRSPQASYAPRQFARGEFGATSLAVHTPMGRSGDTSGMIYWLNQGALRRIQNLECTLP